MIKLLSVLFIVISNLTFAQRVHSPLFIEHNSIYSDNSQIEYITYKIPYKNLLFVKTNDVYSTSFTLTLEFYKEEEFVSREIAKPSFLSTNYEETLSGDKYFQDVIKIDLEPGTYNLSSVLSLGGTDLEHKIPSQKLVIDTLENSKTISPIIVKQNDNPKEIRYTLANFGHKIPFASQKYDLVLGVIDSSIAEIKFSFNQFEKTVYKDSIKSFAIGNYTIEKNNEEIEVVVSDNHQLNLFRITDFSHLLEEGISELVVSYDTTEIKFPLNTVWIEKPRVLNNPEYSIKLLGYIEEDDIVGNLLSSKEDVYYKKLSEYWNTTYPSNGMKFNYAMEEYYERADYAVKNLSSLNSIDGAERDRGKIYIMYGEPTSIDRNYTEMNEIVEIWTYDNAGRTFVFKDTNGTGKFDIVK